ncbi:NAD(+)/NADH kinase, partial [Candidatus Woesearchaeota archaeon]|nr:NAD(+)/NADH kinase [Candidatus Woesearchaeota archaeon]
MEQSSEDVARMRKSHEEQKRTLETVMGELTKQGIAYETAHRAQLGEMRERMQEYDLVVTVGGDGTFLEASHYVEHTPMLGVNSDSNHSVGFYCATNGEHFAELLQNLNQTPKTTVSRLEIILQGKKISEPVLNDVLIAHHNPAAMTRYT